MVAQIILCDGFEVVPPPEMNDLILFETDQSGGESTVTTEEDVNVFSGDSSPGGEAEEEWSEPKPFSFYFVKQHAYDDPDIKAKINEADSEIYQCNKRTIDISNAQKSERDNLSSLYAQMESFGSKSEGCKVVLEEKKRECDSLQEGLRCSSTDHQLCFSKEELETITWNVNNLSDKMREIQNTIMALDVELAHVLEQRDRSYEKIKMLRIQRDKGNAAFYQSLAVISKAKELAASGNVRDLEVYASSEVDRFMTRWNNDKAYRDDYVKRISNSLCERHMSQDGRIRDPEGELVQDKEALVNNRKEGEVIHKMNVITDKEKKEGKNKEIGFNKSSVEESDVTDMDLQVYEKEEEEIDEETLKERKREEQLEKARLAMERKRKLQEKSAAKAAIRAQKEAEKKLKECEKKAKKKAAANSSSPRELDQSGEAMDELEEVRTLAVSGKEKQRSMFPKQRSFRYKNRGRGTEALPKAILNRRKAHKYWLWGLSSAALALSLVLLFLFLQ